MLTTCNGDDDDEMYSHRCVKCCSPYTILRFLPLITTGGLLGDEDSGVLRCCVVLGEGATLTPFGALAFTPFTFGCFPFAIGL